MHKLAPFLRVPRLGGTPGLRLFGGFAFQGALQGLVEGGLGFVVFLLGDEALFVLDFEVEEFVLEGLEEHRRAASGRLGPWGGRVRTR